MATEKQKAAAKRNGKKMGKAGLKRAVARAKS
jgi:hypothetical protein